MNEAKHIALLGSTGSIGKQTLDIVRKHKDLFTVEVLTANDNADLLISQALEFQPNAVVIANERKYLQVKQALKDTYIKVFAGKKSIEDVVTFEYIDLVLVALVGFAGLAPSVSAIENCKTIALANKETLVVAGEIITRLAEKKQVGIIPVDSEHSAIFQCLQGEYQNPIKKILLTASGGVFRGKTKSDLEKVTLNQALKNPNWTMGQKVTIDSATLMNKGLEMIEAKWLFGLEAENIIPIIHPQSVVHSMVEFADGSIKAQMSAPDMHLAIAYALSFPLRLKEAVVETDFFKLQNLTFEQPDRETFPCLDFAFKAIGKGGNMPCIMNAANEFAVEKFLKGKISFTEIPNIIDKAMQKCSFVAKPSLDDYFLTDKEVKLWLENNM